MENLALARQRMVETQLVARGIRSQPVLDAMATVPREKFIAGHQAPYAYDDAPLPIAAGQTISQPYIVAYMIEALQLKGGETVLEIGSGSGYAAAVLAQIAGEVYTVECIEELAESAREALRSVGCDNVQVIHDDGTLGYAEQAPYDAIVVTAGGPAVPEALKQQLAIGGRLVMPVGDRYQFQQLQRVTRTTESEYVSEQLVDVRFVPLLGEQGWSD